MGGGSRGVLRWMSLSLAVIRYRGKYWPLQTNNRETSSITIIIIIIIIECLLVNHNRAFNDYNGKKATTYYDHMIKMYIV